MQRLTGESSSWPECQWQVESLNVCCTWGKRNGFSRAFHSDPVFWSVYTLRTACIPPVITPTHENMHQQQGLNVKFITILSLHPVPVYSLPYFKPNTCFYVWAEASLHNWFSIVYLLKCTIFIEKKKKKKKRSRSVASWLSCHCIKQDLLGREKSVPSQPYTCHYHYKVW